MVDIFLQVDGIKGESTDADHKDWIEALSVNESMSLASSPNPSPGGGAGAGKVTFNPFTITKSIDVASPQLYESCASGKHIKTVTIELMRTSGGQRVKYMTVVLNECIISHAAIAGSGESPTETIGIGYGTIKWTYTQQKRPDGSAGGNVATGWDLTANKAA